MHICLSAHCQNQHGSGHGHDSYNSLDFSGSTLFYWIGSRHADQIIIWEEEVEREKGVTNDSCWIRDTRVD